MLVPRSSVFPIQNVSAAALLAAHREPMKKGEGIREERKRTGEGRTSKRDRNKRQKRKQIQSPSTPQALDMSTTACDNYTLTMIEKQ